MISASIEVTAQFYDLDPMGIVWHGNYIRFLEQARCDLLDKIGYDYQAMDKSGYSWPIVDLRIKYIRPTRFQQKLRVEATIVESANRLKIDYRIYDLLSGETVTKASTIQVAIDRATDELCLECPPALTDRVRAHL